MTRRLWVRGNLVVGAVLTGAIAAMALLGTVWTPYGTQDLDLAARLSGPTATHWLGTDYLGRDLLSMAMLGVGASLATAVSAVGIGAVIGVPLGLAAAVFRRQADLPVANAIDLMFAFPVLLTALLATAVYGPGAINAVIAIAIFDIAVFARITRGAAIQVMRQDYVRAAFALGRSRWAVAGRHVLPNVTGVIIVQATVLLAVAILAEAGLTYLGLGAQPPHPTLGKMLLEAQVFMHLDANQAIVPGTVIAVAVLGLNLLGDGLRDVLDPHLAVARLHTHGGSLADADVPRRSAPKR